MPAASAASAPAVVPPLAVMNAGFQVDACVVSNTALKLPLVTPRGKPVKLGVVVATPAVPGGATQQWMCEAVVGALRPLNTALTCSWWVVVSSETVDDPTPGDELTGFSFAPF